ncbi:hypothetical protein HMPREF1624_05301 [Sporothrix schenckii ATCC 58251]|uniref:Uncharacterized protein n=1 Tax=Sporothrix schenckii (strain ATCC 58251 / de Perez 2211183) TaxID=1391915 RepID=U7PSE9_SPOS1|nr:hypothetical protein HMPREF1624_05301 [Sporothrix schenckii ATCC 58251]
MADPMACDGDHKCSLDFNEELDRFVCRDQDFGHTMLEHLEDNALADERLPVNKSVWVEFRDTKSLGTTNMGRDLLVVIACPTACIVARFGLPHGRVDAGASHLDMLEEKESAFNFIALLKEMIQEVVAGSHFECPSSDIVCVVLGPVDELDQGCIEHHVLRIIKSGLECLQLQPVFRQLDEPTGDVRCNKALGSVVVLAPEITHTALPTLLIDDEELLSLPPPPESDVLWLGD